MRARCYAVRVSSGYDLVARACGLALYACTCAALACSSSRAAADQAAPAFSAAHPAVARVIAIGDLHGDVAATRRALQLAGAIDPSDHWVGGHLVVVQTGDELDRGDDERAIAQLFDHLQVEAKQAGGLLLLLNGNHELMNVAGDFRYVTPHGFESFASYATEPPPRGESASGRAAAFAPGGPLAKQLASRPIIAAVGDTLFAHGGVLMAHVVYGLDRINREASAWMQGGAAPAQLMAEDSPVWTRLYSQGLPSGAACAQLAEVLARTHTQRLVVGHTVQHEINSACQGRVWRIDVGLSGYYGGPTQVLEIEAGAVRVLGLPQR
jgi:hypothetical protein